MYDDCCKLTMYPLQMVLPLISQHVGTSQSTSTIGNNGSSRGHSYHSSSHHQHGHGSASSRLTTLSQHLPEELLNCIQPTLNHLAKSLANASKESKSSCGGGLTNGKSACTAASSCTVPSIVWPPLQKPVRAKPAAVQSGSGQGTPRKTWQSCANLDVAPVVDCSEYPHLSEVLTGKCKLGTSQQCSSDARPSQQSSSDARLSQECSSDARPSQQCSNDAIFSQQCSSDFRPSQQSSNDARPSQQCSSDARPSQQCSSDARPSQQSSNDARHSQQCSSDSRPSQQCSNDARPIQQCSSDSKLSQQFSNDARPSQQCSSDARPSQQCSSDSRPSQQCSSDSRPSQQCSNDARPSQQCSTDARAPSLLGNSADDTNGSNTTGNCTNRITNGPACDVSVDPVNYEHVVSGQNNGQTQGTVINSDNVKTVIDEGVNILLDQVCDNVSLVNIKSTSSAPAPMNKCKSSANCDNGSNCVCCRNMARSGSRQAGISGRKVVRKKSSTSSPVAGLAQTSRRTVDADTVAAKSDPFGLNGIPELTINTGINGTSMSEHVCIDHCCSNGTPQTLTKATESLLGPAPLSNCTNTISPTLGRHNHSIENKSAQVDVSCVNKSGEQHIVNNDDVNKLAQDVRTPVDSVNNTSSALSNSLPLGCETICKYVEKTSKSVHVMSAQPSCDIKHKEPTHSQETQPTHSKMQSQSPQYVNNSSATENRDYYKSRNSGEFDEIYTQQFGENEKYGQYLKSNGDLCKTNDKHYNGDTNVLNDCLHCDQNESIVNHNKSNERCTESNGNYQRSNENESSINQCVNNTISEYMNNARDETVDTKSDYVHQDNHNSCMDGKSNTNHPELMNNDNNSCRDIKLVDSNNSEQHTVGNTLADYCSNECGEDNGKTYQKSFVEYIDKSGRKYYRYGGYAQPSRSSNSSPSNSSGTNSIKENYGSRYNRNQGHYSGYYQGGHYNNYGRHHASLQSSRTNSYDDLKHNERFHDNSDRRANSNSNVSYSDNYSRTYKNSNTMQHYDNSGTYRRNYNEWRNGANNMQRRPSRYVDNNPNSTTTGPRHWNNGTNYTRGHYHQYQYNNNRNNSNSNYNQQNYVKYPNNSAKKNELSTIVNSSSGVARNSKGGECDSSGVGYTREGDNNSPDHHGSASSLSSSSNGSSGGENKTGTKVLKRVHTVNSNTNSNVTNGEQVLATSSEQQRHTVIRNQRAASPSEAHHLQYDTKRRNTSNISSNGGLSHPYQHWGLKHTALHPGLTNSSAAELNFYLAMARSTGSVSPLALHLAPPHPPPLMTHVLASPTMLTDVPWHVPAFETWDPLSKAIWTKFLSAQQTEKRFHQKMLLTCEVEKYVRFILREPHFRLFVVGSTMSGFGTDSSDIDMCLGIRPYEFDRVQAIRVLGTLERNKHHYVSDLFKSAELISAKVPILKFQDGLFKLEVDLNCNNVVGVRNTHLLYCYAQMDWRIRPLVLLVKLWAQTHNINDAKNMTISSYSLSLMVIHFLQCGTSPPVLPNLMSQYPGKFSPTSNIESIQLNETLAPYHSSNKESLGTLLTQFFQYYSNFEYFKYAISVRRGAKISIEECRKHKSPQNKFNHWKYLCIEEPFDLTNAAHSVYNLEVFEHIRGVIRESSYLLSSRQDLNSIFDSLSQQKLTGFS